MEYIIIFIILAFIISISLKIYKNKLIRQLIQYLQDDDFESFDILINSSRIKFLIIPFQIDYMKLNSAILRKNNKMVLEHLEDFKNKRLSNKQKELIYMMGFNYFISTEDKRNSKKYLSMIKELNSNEKMIKETEVMYDIYIEKGYKYLDRLIDETKDLEDINKGVNEFLISLMYKNKGDNEKSDYYLKLSKKHINMNNKREANN